jgi:cytochrome bd-type quinol oxidase subunit 2
VSSTNQKNKKMKKIVKILGSKRSHQTQRSHRKYTKGLAKILIELTILTGLILVAISAPAALADGASSLPLSDGSSYVGIPTPKSTATGQAIVIGGIEKAIGYFKVLIGIVAIFMIILMGAKLVTSGGNEESVKKATTGLMYSVIAFAIISLSQELGQIVGFFDEGATFGTQKSTGGIIANPGEIIERVNLFDKQVEIVMTFIKYLIGSLAVVMLVVNGSRLVVGGGEEENLKKARNGVAYSLGGLVLIYLADIVVDKIFYKLDKTIYSGIEGAHPEADLPRGLDEIVGITNFIVSFIGPLLFLLLIVGGVMYLVSGGEEEKMSKAKRLIVAALIGVIVVYGAFAIVSTVIAGYFAPVETGEEIVTLLNNINLFA